MGKKTKIIVKDYLIITLGLLINALGWTAFLIPAEIVGGGVSGIASLIFYASGLPVAVSFFAINSILIFVSIKILGKGFGIKTIYSVLVLTGFFALFQHLIKEPIVNEDFMATIIGAALAGAGVGFVFTRGGSTGGTDIIAMIVNKYRNISPGKTILFADFFIISSSFIVFISLEKIVYGFVCMAVLAYTVDLVLSGSKQSVQIFVFSKCYEKIADRITHELNRGVTLIDGKGWYTKEDTKILLVIARKHESPNIIRLIKEEDPVGFISMGTVMGVYGGGFEELRA